MPVLLTLITKRWFWMLIVGVIVSFIIWRNWVRIKALLRQKRGDFQSTPISDERKAELKTVAKNAHKAIHETWSSHSAGEREDILNVLNHINDNELLFTAKFYKKELNNGVSLYQDVRDEVMWFSNIDNRLMAALERIGEV